jgi:hypothetical protein
MMSLHSGFSSIDKIFNKAQTAKYYMSIRLETDGLFISVYDPDSQKYVAIESSLHATSSELYNYISKHEWIRNRFSKIIVILPSKHYTIVPDALYKVDNVADYYSFVHELKAGYEIRTVDISEINAKLVYAVDSNYIDISKEFFSVSFIIPQPGAFLLYVLPRFKNTRSSMIFMNLHNDNFDLLVLEDGKMMRFFNNFMSKADEDIVYYLLFVIDQLALNPESVKVVLSGVTEDKSSLIRLLKKYIRFVEIIQHDSNLDSSYILNEVDKHKYLDILNPMLCEL